MSAGIVARLVLLGAIWGSSYLFMRITVPAIGAAPTAGGRLALAALLLVLLVRAMGRRLEWRARWRDYLVVGLLSSGVPFLLFAYAAHHLPAGYSALLNSTTPLFAVLIAFAATGFRPSGSKSLGVLVGIAGVGILAGFSAVAWNAGVALAFGACLVAALLYAFAATEIRKRFAGADPVAVAAGSMVAATLVVGPVALYELPAAWPASGPLFALVVLGVVCTALANVIYFGLVKQAGAERATTVTFLMPLFAQVWGALFLGEGISAATLAGLGLVLFAVALVFERVPGLARLIAAIERFGAMHAPRGVEPIHPPPPCR
jgi:drug/metabolite transporter (DMT)-like permease